MAELVVVRVTLQLAWRLFAPKTASMLENGDIAEEKLRQMLLSEFNKIHEHLNALRRKELVAAMAFLETGFELLNKDVKTAKDEFRKARDAAQMAFGVVPDVCDKVLATKILVTATFHEFNDNAETSRTLCSKYLERMNTMPEVVRACQLIFSPQKTLTSKILSISGKTKRDDILQFVAEVNKCVWDYFTEQLKTNLTPAPVIRFGSYHINPVTDMILQRKPYAICELDTDLAGFISATMSEEHIFAALGQISGALVQNDIIAISLTNGNITHLLGHEGLVLSLASNSMYLFSGSYDKTILIWDIKTLKPIKQLTGHTGSVRSVCLSESFLFSASTDATIRIWNLDNDFSCYKALDTLQAISKVTCSQRKFLFCLNGIGSVQIWDVPKMTLLHTVETNHKAYNVVANDNYMYVAVKLSTGDEVQCWNLGSLTNMASIKESGNNIAKFYNSPYLFCGDNTIKMYSTQSQRLIMEELIQTWRGELGQQVKHLWMNGCDLYVLIETNTGKNYIVKY